MLTFESYMDPDVVGTTGISSGADPRTQGMWSWGASARMIIVLLNRGNTFNIVFCKVPQEKFSHKKIVYSSHNLFAREKLVTNCFHFLTFILWQIKKTFRPLHRLENYNILRCIKIKIPTLIFWHSHHSTLLNSWRS